MAETLAGLDVSHYQQQIDWPRVAGAGKVFAFIKASEGARSPDPRFDENRRGAHSNSIVAGAYHFFRPRVGVDDQVKLFLAGVQALESGELPPILDLEVPEDWVGIPMPDRISLVVDWLGQVEKALGVQPFVYTSDGFMKSVLGGAPELAKYQLWLANYNLNPSVPAPWTDWTFWQYTQTGTVDGVNGNVDLDLFNGPLERLNAFVVRPQPTGALTRNAPLERTHIVIANADPIASIAHARAVVDHHLTDLDHDPLRRRALQAARTHLDRALGSVVPRQGRRAPPKARRRASRPSSRRKG
jgi:GH25 family lysozyme M1 (1,4-beta-N-acetylmuramidase)